MRAEGKKRSAPAVSPVTEGFVRERHIRPTARGEAHWQRDSLQRALRFLPMLLACRPSILKDKQFGAFSPVVNATENQVGCAARLQLSL